MKGYSVAISGATALVGAPGIPIENRFRGVVYSYMRTAAGWKRRATLTDGRNDGFGHTMAISGNTAVVGAWNEAWVLARAGDSWHRQPQPIIPPTASGTNYITSVAISGKTIVIGTDNQGTHYAGEAFIYAYSRGGWHRQADLKSHPGDYLFGAQVAISGNIAVVGAGIYWNEGIDYVYQRSKGWSQQALISGGGYVAIHRDMIFIGDSDPRGARGKVIVYKYSTAQSWSPQEILLQPDEVRDSGFGSTVALSGRRLLVSAPNQDRKACGAVYEFLRSGAIWRYKAQVINPDCADGDSFGYSLAISGRTAVIGAPSMNNSRGAAYVEPILY